MSEQQVKAFLDQAKVDPRLKEQLKAEGSDPVTIAAAAGFAFSAADLARYQAHRVLQLSDEDLQCVSGGIVVLAGADWRWLLSD
jgi:predicted ribosomally synthesized peptide with nif11-like leader